MDDLSISLTPALFFGAQTDQERRQREYARFDPVLTYKNAFGDIVPAPRNSTALTDVCPRDALVRVLFANSEPDLLIPEHVAGFPDAKPCRLWTGLRTQDGYGVAKVRVKRRMVSLPAHRASLLLRDGCLPSGLLGRHLCHVPACIEPTHLAWGTDSDNHCDSAARKARYWGKQLKPYNIPLAQQACILRVHAEQGLDARTLHLLTGFKVITIQALLEAGHVLNGGG